MRGSQRHILGALLAAVACVLWLVPVAAASGGSGSSGVYDQYTEQVPTAGGPHNTGSAGPGGTGGSGPTGGSGGTVAIVLPANLSKDGGNDAKKLRDVATSARYGAPSKTVPLPEGSNNSPAALSSAVNAITAGSDGHMVGLFVALLAVTAVSVGFAASRRRT